MTPGLPRLGEPAPEFDLPGADLVRVRSGDLRGRSVLIVFFPFAFTPVCTSELAVLRDGLATEDGDLSIVAISCDAPATLRAFAEQEKLPFPLLSDFWPHGGTAERFGVFNDAIGAPLRGTFIVDGAGTLRWSVVHGLADARDADVYRRVLDGL